MKLKYCDEAIIDDEIINKNLLDSTRKEAIDDFWKHFHLKESLLKQKSIQKWLNEGDQNTRYFHSMIKGIKRRNYIISFQKSEGIELKM